MTRVRSAVMTSMQTIEVLTHDSCNFIIALRRETADRPLLRGDAGYEQARRHIDTWIGRALSCGVKRDVIDDVTYALACLADSTAGRPPGLWQNCPLVDHYFADAAADTFFTRLHQARLKGHQEVLQLYAVCLALGYRGKMNPAQAEAALATLDTMLVRPPRSASTIPTEKLKSPEGPPWHQWWLVAGAILASAVVFGGLAAAAHNDAVTLVDWVNNLLRG